MAIDATTQTVFLVCATLLACACTKRAPAAEACTLPTKVRLEASAQLNPDEQDRPLPTVIRLYQLRDVTLVEQADFQDVWEKPKETLGEQLFKAQELTLFPGQTEDVEVALAPEAKYLVGVAIFRQPSGSAWRSIVALPASERMCSAYAQAGAPVPAVHYRFDRFRVESKSYLLGADGEGELPRDVAATSDR